MKKDPTPELKDDSDAALSSDGGGKDDTSERARALKKAKSPIHDLTVAANAHETGNILNLKKTKEAAIKEGMSYVAKMTLQDSLKPHVGVLVLEDTNPRNIPKQPAGVQASGKKSNLGSKRGSTQSVPQEPAEKELPPNYQVTKKGGPFVRKATDR